MDTIKVFSVSYVGWMRERIRKMLVVHKYSVYTCPDQAVSRQWYWVMAFGGIDTAAKSMKVV